MSWSYWSCALLFSAAIAGRSDAATSLATTPAVVAAPHILINAPSSTKPGQLCCVFVYAPGVDVLSASVEFGPNELDAHVTRLGDGAFIICFDVPNGTSGSTITVTASGGGASASASIPVL